VNWGRLNVPPRRQEVKDIKKERRGKGIKKGLKMKERKEEQIRGTNNEGRDEKRR